MKKGSHFFAVFTRASESVRDRLDFRLPGLYGVKLSLMEIHHLIKRPDDLIEKSSSELLLSIIMFVFQMKYYDIAFSYSVKKQVKKFHFCFIYIVYLPFLP